MTEGFPPPSLTKASLSMAQNTNQVNNRLLNKETFGVRESFKFHEINEAYKTMGFFVVVQNRELSLIKINL